jgi:tetratricopeptide (TPR) repeat protein
MEFHPKSDDIYNRGEIMPTNISDINDYNTLYSAYARLKNEGDHTTSAKNAKAIFGKNMDIDGDNTVELWEIMQKANEAQNKIIFNEIKPLKTVQNSKYPFISDNNPIRIILSIESGITGEKKIAKAYILINNIIKVAKEKITSAMSPTEKLQKLYRIIRDDFNIQYGDTDLLSEGLNKENRTVDCETGSFIFIAVAHEMGWPVYLLTSNDHAFVYWRFDDKNHFGFETTKRGGLAPEDGKLVDQAAESSYKNHSNYLFASAYFRRGYVCNKLQAIKEYNRVIQLRPDHALAYSNRGATYRKLGVYEMAVSDYTNAIKFSPGYPDFYRNRAFSYYDLKRYDLAIKDFNVAIEKGSGGSSSYYCRGYALLNSSNYKLAVEDIAKATGIVCQDNLLIPIEEKCHDMKAYFLNHLYPGFRHVTY